MFKRIIGRIVIVLLIILFAYIIKSQILAMIAVFGGFIWIMNSGSDMD